MHIAHMIDSLSDDKNNSTLAFALLLLSFQYGIEKIQCFDSRRMHEGY